MLSNSGMTPADLAAVTGGDGMWIIIFILFFAFGGWGNNQGAQDNYVLTSDFSQLSRQISDSAAMAERKLDGISNGICSLGYDQLAQMNGINTNILTQANNTNLSMLNGFNNLQSAVNTGFCQTNYNNSNNTRDIIDSQNANTREILAAIEANKVEALNQRIAEQNQQICSLQLAASQQAQNNTIISTLRPAPVPAYTVQNPYCNCGYGCGCN